MTTLREAPRVGRQLLSSVSHLRPRAPGLDRYASTESTPPVVPDVELDSGLATPIVTRESINILDPRKRASSRTHELPHERYRFHAPKYYRGPLHPVQPPPSSDPIARDFAPGPFNLPRLKQTYQSTIASDIMTMMYQHTPPGTPDKPERIRLREWDDSSPYMKNRPKRGPRGADVLFPLEKSIDWRNIPEIRAVHIAMYLPQAKKNIDHITVGRAVLQSIAGVRTATTATRCSIYGNQAWEFIDKTINLVFPKIKEWRGFKGTTGDSTGNIGFGLEPQDMQNYPEVEAAYSMYPSKMIPGCRVVLETTAKSDRHARILCKALGIPFYGKIVD
ncbi:hypothetical protein E0Z10_g11024 [Xylaria hypoxylon]|uniref:Large ribosomal subunit protein uL5 C-terminal domain-containing protein n=1 Tax=Xylaria hypoxylon TaxID=37992 RepID=A0A4Z0YE50_9PEZI|nr:hypothetical protein E0Z10_g11024 [Xylaria hypoxylon]